MMAGKDRSVESRTRPRQLRGNVSRLVRRELQRTWPSYLTSGVVNALFGLIAVFIVWESVALEPGGDTFSPEFWADWLFLFALVNLPVNWTSRSYWQTRSDPFGEHLDFLRALPVSAEQVVASRALVIAGSTPIMSCVFFIPGYALISGMTTVVGPLVFFWFAATWASYALLGGGIYLFMELGIRGGRLRFWALLVWCLPILAVVLVFNLALETPLVSGSFGLVEEYGALPAVAALAAGAAGFWMCAGATIRRVKKGGV